MAVRVVDAAPDQSAPTDKWLKPDVHRKSLFRNTVGETGDKLSTKRIGRGTKEAGANPEDAVFTPALKEQYRRYLTGYVDRLLELKKIPGSTPGKSLYDEVLDSGDHSIDKILVDRLTSTNQGIEETDLEKIKDFVMSSEGKKITTVHWEQNLSRMQLAIGVDFAATPEGRRQALAQNGRFRTDINAGVLRKYEEAIPGTPAQRQDFSRLSTGLAIAGRLVFGPGGYLLGGAPAAILGAREGLRYLRREGLVFDMKQSVGGFKAISGSKTEKAFAKAVFGIDADDYKVIPAVAGVPEHIELKVAHSTMSRNVDETQERIVLGLHARREFYTALGVPQDKLDALPEQYLLRLSATNPLEAEKTTAYWETRIMELFNPNGGGIKDRAGRRRGSLGFNAADLDTKGNIGRIYSARNTILAELMQQLIDKEVIIDKSNVDRATILGGKMTRLSSDEGKAALKTQFEKIKNSLTADKGLLGEDKTLLDTHATNLAELQKARKELSAQLAGIPIPGTVSEKIDGLKAFIDSSGANISIGGRVIISLVDREIGINTKMATALNKMPKIKKGETEERYNARTAPLEAAIRAKFQRELNALENDKQFINQLIEHLNTLNGTVIEKQNELGETKEAAVKMKVIDSAKDFTDITNWGISDTDLRTQTIQQILAQINAINALNPAIGWGENKNEKNDFRTRVYRAMAEARARPLFPSSPDFDLLNNPAGLNISEYKLRTLTDTEIQALVGAGANIAQIQEAMKIAGERLNARSTGLSETITFTQEKIIEQEELASGVSVQEDVDFLKTTIALIKRRAEDGEFPTDLVKAPAEYVDTGIIAATDRTFTKEEKDANQPKGYYEILNLIAGKAGKGYKDSNTRGSDFVVISKVITPDRMARVLNESLDLFAGPTHPLIDILTEAANRFNNKEIEGSDMQRFIGQLTDELYEEGRAIPAA